MSGNTSADTLARLGRDKMQAAPHIQLKSNLEGVSKFTAPAADLAAAAAANKVGSKKTLVFGAYFYNDVVGQIETILTNSQCPQYDVTTVKEGNCTVDFFKTLHTYGIIAGVTHGETFYNGILSLWADKWKWSTIGGQVVLFTNTTLTDANKALYETDIKNGRLAVHPTGLIAILPSFISYYNSGFPDSLVCIASCRGLFSGSIFSPSFNVSRAAAQSPARHWVSAKRTRASAARSFWAATCSGVRLSLRIEIAWVQLFSRRNTLATVIRTARSGLSVSRAARYLATSWLFPKPAWAAAYASTRAG